MQRFIPIVIGLLCASIGLLHCNPLGAVVVSTTNGNTDAASLQAAGGPADPGDPSVHGWVNVGKSSTGNATITYLGNGWAITAGHVAIGNYLNGDEEPPTPVHFGSNTYLVTDIRTLHNPDNSEADLKIFRLLDDPGLPSLIPNLINDASPSGRVIMIGNGLSTVSSQQYWDGSSTPWQTDPTPPANPGSSDFSGFYTDTNSSHVIRWGENSVLNTNVNMASVRGFTTEFDNTLYTGTVPRDFEAQGSLGDSGGPGFTLVGGQWKLSGIMTNILVYSTQPPPPPDPPLTFQTAVFGNETLFADLRFYRNEILAIVPEPQSYVLALLAAAGVVLAGRRRRR